MKISIIIPVYNVAPYIEECLNSVIAQTYKGEMECVLVDDCGIDDSVAICERIIKKYGGPISFRFVHHERNKGLSAARNTGIDTSSGDWLYFLDSDDWIIPECIELMVKCLETYPESEMIFAGARVSNSKLAYMMDYENRDIPPLSNNPLWIKRAMLFNVLNVTAWNKLIRKDLVVQNQCYFAEGYIYEDEIWNFELSKVLKCISICSHNTYCYRIRSNSITFGCDAINRFRNRLRLQRKQISIIPVKDKEFYVKKIWQELIISYRNASDDNSRYEIWTLFGELLRKTDLSMFPAVCLSYMLPYWFLKVRAVNWFFSKYDKCPHDVNVIV